MRDRRPYLRRLCQTLTEATGLPAHYFPGPTHWGGWFALEAAPDAFLTWQGKRKSLKGDVATLIERWLVGRLRRWEGAHWAPPIASVYPPTKGGEKE